MVADVFLSYARQATQTSADALSTALTAAGVSVFLDHEDIPYGTEIPDRLADALLGARVVVVFLEPIYFTRWYCRLEFKLATAVAARDSAAALHVVLALPADSADVARLGPDLDELPPALRATNWPNAADTAALVRLVLQRRASTPAPLGDAVERVLGADAARSILTDPARLPQPLRLGPMPVVVPDSMRGSLRSEFVGREHDLWRLHQALAPAEQRRGHAALTAAVRGLGGVGKTQLAAEYFYRYGPRHYTGGLFWLDAKRDASEQHHAVLRALGLEAQDFEVLRTAVGADRVGAVLAARLAVGLRQLPADRPALLVVDDVPDAAEVPHGASAAPAGAAKPPPLDNWCPAPDAAACLTTSRGVVAFRGGGALARYAVGVLGPEPAVALLRRDVAAGAALSNIEWGEVAAWVGRLPLALTVLNRALRPEARALRPAELLRAARAGAGLTSQIDRAKADLDVTSPDATLRGVTEAFRLSFDGLPPAAQEAARRLACLAPEPVPVELLDALGPACADRGVQALLLARSFVTPPEPSDADRRPYDSAATNAAPTTPSRPVSIEMYGTVHRVLADAVRSFSPELTSDIRAVVATLAAVITPKRARDPGHWVLLSACAPHALAALALADAHDAHDVLPEGSPSIKLSSVLIGFADSRGDYRTARDQASAALKLAEHLLPREHVQRLGAMSNLAHALRMLGDFTEARALQERVLEAQTRLLGPEHPDTLTVMTNLARSLADSADFAGARALDERALAARTRLLGPEHPDTLLSMNNLADTVRAMGDFGEARALQERVLEARTRVLGPEHPDTLTAMTNLAHTLGDSGDLAGARTLEERAVEMQTRLLGAEHPTTLLSINNLAFTLRQVGDVPTARALQARVVEAQTRLLGAEHPDTLASIGNLASTLRKAADFAGARALQEQVLEAQTRLLGPDHPDTLTAMNHLALTLHDVGDLAHARVVEERVFELRARVLGPEHHATLATAGNLAATLADSGDLAGARALQERVVEAQTRILGTEHPATLGNMGNLAKILANGGDLAAARSLEELVLEARSRVLGPEHPDTLTAMNNLAATVYMLADLAAARALQERVLEVRTRVLGAGHPDTLTAMNNLSRTLYVARDLTGAHRLADAAYRGFTSVLGVTHARTRHSREHLETILRAMGESDVVGG